jgi:hypothetical protein
MCTSPVVSFAGSVLAGPRIASDPIPDPADFGSVVSGAAFAGRGLVFGFGPGLGSGIGLGMGTGFGIGLGFGVGSGAVTVVISMGSNVRAASFGGSVSPRAKPTAILAWSPTDKTTDLQPTLTGFDRFSPGGVASDSS